MSAKTHIHICDQCNDKIKKHDKSKVFSFCKECEKEASYLFFECNECLQKYWYVTRYK